MTFTYIERRVINAPSSVIKEERRKIESETEQGVAQSRLSEKLERMAISESESLALITDGRCIQCTFGGEVCLLPVEDNRWAFEMVAKMRANVSPTPTPCPPSATS